MYAKFLQTFTAAACVAGILLTASWWAKLALTAEPARISAPSALIHDPDSSLPGPTKEALSQILTDHFRLTGESVTVGIFAGVSDDVRAHARDLVDQWREGTDRTDIRHVLIALYPDSRAATVANDYDLDAILTADATENVISEMESLLRSGETGSSEALAMAAVQGTLGTLALLKSPLIETGEAREALAKAGVSPDRSIRTESAGWAVTAALLGMALILVIPFFVITGDSHYSTEARIRTHALMIAGTSWIRARTSRGRQSAVTPAGGTNGNW